jgi:hypothetical protein
VISSCLDNLFVVGVNVIHSRFKDIILYPGHGESTKLGIEIEKLVRL